MEEKNRKAKCWQPVKLLDKKYIVVKQHANVCRSKCGPWEDLRKSLPLGLGMGSGCLVRVGGEVGVDPGGLKAHCTLYWWKLSSFPFWFFSQLGPCICGGCTYRLPKPDTCVHPGV